LAGGSSYTGQVNITYLGIEGRICNDGWNDKAARVVCHELGYPDGMAIPLPTSRCNLKRYFNSQSIFTFEMKPLGISGQLEIIHFTRS
jgi:hypothetical protein